MPAITVLDYEMPLNEALKLYTNPFERVLESLKDFEL